MPNRSLEEFTYLTVVRLSEPKLQAMPRAALVKPAEWDTDLPSRTAHQSSELAYGHLLRFRQTWKAHGYTLGDLLYSLPLAPGQKKQIAVVDWERREAASRTEDSALRDQLTNSLVRDRDVSDIVRAALAERLQGSSLSLTGGSASGASGAGSGSAQSGSAGGSMGGVMSTFGGGGFGYTTAGQASNRDLTASEMQRIHDATMQAASSVRSLRTTVVQTVTQADSTKVTTEVVANHNHCHAMTIEYFEVLRHFLVEQKLDAVEPCIFVPLAIAAFDRARALKWRAFLSPRLLDPSLTDGFDAAERSEIADNIGDDDVISVKATLQVVFRIARPLEHWAEMGTPPSGWHGDYYGHDHAETSSDRWRPITDLINPVDQASGGQGWVYSFDRTHYAFNPDTGEPRPKDSTLQVPTSRLEADFQAEVAPKVAAAFVRFFDSWVWITTLGAAGKPIGAVPCTASLARIIHDGAAVDEIERGSAEEGSRWRALRRRETGVGGVRRR